MSGGSSRQEPVPCDIGTFTRKRGVALLAGQHLSRPCAVELLRDVGELGPASDGAGAGALHCGGGSEPKPLLGQCACGAVGRTRGRRPQRAWLDSQATIGWQAKDGRGCSGAPTP
mmetsp:Transcript_82159/g.241218  ORF Transcript_82159/g.241218 Transcript_82159/m.241218 type:complete len:115 (-) Transcript_82159:705-1049(-)